MELNQIFLLAGAVLFLSLILLGSGIALQRSKRERERESKRIVREKRTTQEPAGAGAEPQEILRVMRDPAGEGLAVQVMGETARSAADMTPGGWAQLKRVMGELEGWVGASAAEQSGAAPQTAGPPVAQTSQEAGRAAPPKGAPPGTPFADSLPKPVGVGDVLPFRRKKIPALYKAPPAPLSITAQIDEIVQAMLLRSPLAGREVRLFEGPDGGLRIVAGGRQYTAIDEVEDPDVKALIRGAVKAWNEKNRINPGTPRAGGS